MVKLRKRTTPISNHPSDGFWKKNALTILFTVINLGLTSTTVYYNYFRVVEHLNATIIYNDSLEELFEDTVTVRVAIFNSGNRQALVSNMRLTMVRQKDGAFSSWQSIPQKYYDTQLPMVIQPNQISMIRFRTPSSNADFFANAFDCASPTNPDSTHKDKCVDLGIYWIAVNAEGKSYEGLAIAARLTVDKHGVVGIGHWGNNIDLYKNINEK